MICVRGVYNAALITKRADFAEKHDHCSGSLERGELLPALIAKQDDTLRIVETIDIAAPIDFFGRPFSFGDFAYTVIQHEALHRGQWSMYAVLGGFATPPLWRNRWGL